MKITSTGQTLGALIEDFDLSLTSTDENIEEIIQALGRYGVISFPNQNLSSKQLRDFSARFGELEINVANAHQDAGLPEVMILSNMIENGKPMGLSDAGQDWHTDMSYSHLIAFTNVLYGIEIPMRNGQSLGNTEFCNMHAAFADLPDTWKDKLRGKTATHDFAKFWDNMRLKPGSQRKPLTPEQRRAKPPVSHPVVMMHPITKKEILYLNPGYSIRINEMSQLESDEALAFLFEHQLNSAYKYKHEWKKGNVLMWDNMGTIHNAVADYLPSEHRYIKRCQVMATRFF
jgi:taurine dioxygenase